jgi:hypothetical protein
VLFRVHKSAAIISIMENAFDAEVLEDLRLDRGLLHADWAIFTSRPSFGGTAGEHMVAAFKDQLASE